jgi:hypothetical protein
VADQKSELLQSLDRALEESRRIRAESTPLLEQAQWPVVEPCKPEPEEAKLPAVDLLLIPRPPLLGFQRNKGNLPSGQPSQSTQLLESNLVKLDSPALSPSKTEDTLSQDSVLEPAGLPEVLVSST